VLQYNPFLYGRWGFAPRLAASMLRRRLDADRPRLALMIHEAYQPRYNWRSALMGSVQWAQLHALYMMSDIAFTSIAQWARMLTRWHPHQTALHLPVGSNLPDARSERDAAREEIGADPATSVVASFGTGHRSRLVNYIVAAVNAIADDHRRVIMLNLGVGAHRLTGVNARVRIIHPGPLPRADVARLLAAGDVFLAPFEDGVSTRRTSLMAALQHGLPVVGTVGRWTDGILRTSEALELVGVGSSQAFAEAAASVAVDAEWRTELGCAAAALYAREFDWPVIAARLCERLEGCRGAHSAISGERNGEGTRTATMEERL
jgi:glycosyltransferase involved in cell wall biosynthesis